MGNNILQVMERLLNARLPAASGGVVQPPLVDPEDELWMHIRLMMMPMTDSMVRPMVEVLEHEKEVLTGEDLAPVRTLAVVLSPMIITMRRNMRRHVHPRRGAVLGNGGHHRGRHDHDDLDNVARVKLSVPKFTGKDVLDAYLYWEEQCDQIFRVHNLSHQRRVNLGSVEFFGWN
uniref:Uncharacterized protein n=1 Tax=Oryza rufipogon TaxID=4529 RepID=A0A0E0QGW8_ORYRU